MAHALKKAPLAIAKWATILFLAGFYLYATAVQSGLYKPHAEQAEAVAESDPATYALVGWALAETGDEILHTYVLDTGLTLGDCYGALGEESYTFGRNRACEIER